MAKDYFSHDYNSRNDIKMIPVLRDHKLRGIGAYWCLVEMLYESNGYILLSELKNISYDLRERESFIRAIVSQYDLFKSDNVKFWSESVLERLKMRFDKSVKATESVNKRWAKHTDVLREENGSNTLKESKVKEIKEKESKVNFLRLREKIYEMSVSVFLKQNNQMFLEQWAMKNKDVSIESVLKKMDEDYVCHSFNNENHLQNSFKSTYEKIKKENGITKTQSSFGSDKNAASRAQADREADEIIRQHITERIGNIE